MNEKALRTLEFTKIIDKLQSLAVSPMAKERAAELKPISDITEIEIWQNETTDATSCTLRKGNMPLGGIKDIREGLKRAEVGGVLSIQELMFVGEFLYVTKKVKNYFKDTGKTEKYEHIENYFEALVTLNALESDISSKILSETQVADDASDALYSVRKEINSSSLRIKDQMNSIIHSQNYKTMLQDSVVTIRNGRYCVPVKQEYKNAFSGMIHDQSSTGATLFMEPMAVVQLNNKIRELELKEKAEVEKILRQLSLQVSENSDIIKNNMELLVKLDFIFAKASLSLTMNGTRPVLNESGIIDLVKARHPLIDKDKIVPTNIYMGKNFTTLLVTGPNTGGKTVTLKTMGLLTLMGQAGLHIPAFDNSELAVFDDVFADIGDEQSIEQSLSTFSSHMSNIVKILEEVNYNSLVLLDELGAGTDPTEGAALAMAIISALLKRDIRTAVTTHYSELKVFAISTDKIENASCEFDVNTLRPTYKLLIGVPGKSNAFAISRRLGLPEAIIDSAREFISHEDIRFEDIITDLEISRKTVEREQLRAEQYMRESESMKKELEKQKHNMEAKKEKIVADAKQEAAQYLQKAKDEADGIIKELLRLQQNYHEKDTRKLMEQSREKLKESLNTAETAAGKKMSKPNKPPEKLVVGDKVYIYSFNQTGIVSSLPDKNGDVIVKAGIMKMKVNITDLTIDNSEDTSKPIAQIKSKAKSMSIKSEVDCRGMMVSEAIEVIDKYIDDAYVAGLLQVTIIHGKGTGALRTAVHQYLSKRSYVEAYRVGKYGEGENGVTIVELKK